MRGQRRGRIDDQADGGIARAVANQRAQHAGGVGAAARAGIVLRVGDDDRARRIARHAHGGLHGLVGVMQRAAESGFGRQHRAFHFARGRVGLRLRGGVRPHGGQAFGKVRSGKTRGERQAGAAALNLRQALVQAARGLDVGGLPAQRNQIRQLAQGATGARRAVQPRREQRGRALPVSAMSMCG